MPRKTDINMFYHGETVAFSFFGKNRGGGVITTPGSQILSMEIAAETYGPAILTFTDSPQVVLTSEPAGEWTVTLTSSDLDALSEGVKYFYNIKTQLTPADPILQAGGAFILQRSI